MTASIQSDRLNLIALSPTFIRASLNGDIHAAQQELRSSVPADWPGDHARLLSLRLQQLEEEPSLVPWLLRAMILKTTRDMVGHIGFHGAPDAEYIRPYSPGAVEFGFTVYSPYRRQGFAREASVALVRWANEVHDVNSFIMTIQPGNIPSQSLAVQLGFVRIGSHIDEVDGVEDIFEYKVSDRRPKSMNSTY